MELMILILRLIGALGGIACLYMWYFFREEEERLVQGKLDTLWVMFDERHSKTVSSHAALMQSAAKVTTSLLDKTFGERLLSLRSVAISCSFAFVSPLLVILLSLLITQTPEQAGSAVWFLYFAILFLFLVAFLPSIFPKLIWLTVLTDLIICVIVLAGGVGELLFERTTMGPIFVTTSITLVPSIVCTILVVAVERRLMRWSSGLNTISKIVGSIFLNLIIAFAIVLIPILISVLFDIRFLLTLPLLNAFTFIIPLTCIVMALFMSGHKILWELLDRPLYHAQRFKLVENKTFLGRVGFVLILFAVWPTQYGIGALLKAFGFQL